MNKDIEPQPSPTNQEDEWLEQISSLPPRSVTHRKRREEQERLKKLAKRGRKKAEEEVEDEWIEETNWEEEVEDEVGEEESEKSKKKPRKRRSFLTIQIILFSFLALILAFLVFWYWQEQQNIATQAPTDPFDRFLEQGGLQPPVVLDEEEDVEPEEEQTQDPNDLSDENSLGEGSNDNQSDESESDFLNGDKQSDPEDDILARHKIQAGETLYRISVNYYGTGQHADALAEFNGIKDKTNISTGTEIIIPKLP